MKLIVQLPCLNEADTLPEALSGLPTAIEGISCIETLVVDDGSHDGTAVVARELGVNHIVRHKQTMGLARAFSTGIETCLRLGADIIVNTDGDNQYPAEEISGLVASIVNGQADLVVGDRQVNQLAHFSWPKKVLQALGSRMVRAVSGTEVPDAPSGFRAYSREAALRLVVLTQYSYTLDTIIQAGKLGLRVTSVPVRVNQTTRPSRLQRNAWHFIKAQAGTILRLYAFYEPLRTFTYIALPFVLSGLALLGRFGYFYLIGDRGVGRYIQSVNIGVGLLLVGVIIGLFGIQADIAARHRQLTQEMVYRLRKWEWDQGGRAGQGLPEESES